MEQGKEQKYTQGRKWRVEAAFTIKNARTKEVVDRWVVKENETTPLTLAPLEQQDLWESRRAWADVAENIKKGDMDAVSGYKSRIENAQRELRRAEKAEGREWERRFFNRIDEKDDDPLFQQVANSVDLAGQLEADKTGGVWRFDPNRAAAAQPPYHKVGSEGLGLSQ